VTEPPAQNVVGPLAVIVGVGGIALTVTVVGADVAPQPFPFETVTEYEPAVVTVIDRVVAPFDHKYESVELFGAVSVTESLTQNVVGPLAVITGTGGTAATPTVALAVVVHPRLSTSIAVTVVGWLFGSVVKSIEVEELGPVIVPFAIVHCALVQYVPGSDGHGTRAWFAPPGQLESKLR
jgi:hypothetical protein